MTNLPPYFVRHRFYDRRSYPEIPGKRRQRFENKFFVAPTHSAPFVIVHVCSCSWKEKKMASVIHTTPLVASFYLGAPNVPCPSCKHLLVTSRRPHHLDVANCRNPRCLAEVTLVCNDVLGSNDGHQSNTFGGRKLRLNHNKSGRVGVLEPART